MEPIVPVKAGPAYVADELALKTAIKNVMLEAGIGAYDTNCAPAGQDLLHFVTDGEDQLHRCAGGLRADTTLKQMNGFIGADLNVWGATIAASTAVAPYTNLDAAGAFTASPQICNTLLSEWAARDDLVEYRYGIVANRNFLACMVQYESGGVQAQGFILWGIPEVFDVRLVNQYARARIASIATTAGSVRRIVLTHNINNALKDGAVYAADTFTQYVQMQTIWAPGDPVGDFGLVTRQPIVAGSLTTSGGMTQFDIDLADGFKQAENTAGLRYFENRGVGDIVSLCSEPSYMYCAARADGNAPTAANANCLLAWMAWAAQLGNLGTVAATNKIFAGLFNADGIGSAQNSDASTASPAFLSPGINSNRSSCFRAHIGVAKAPPAGPLTNVDSQQRRVVGAVRGHYTFHLTGASDLAIATLNGKATERYLLQTYTANGMGSLQQNVGTTTEKYDQAIGPWV